MWFERNTNTAAQHSTARPTALTMAITSKAMAEAHDHQLFTFAFKKDFKQHSVHKSESVVTQNNRQASEACDETSSGPVLSSPSLTIYFQHAHSQQLLTKTYAKCLQVLVGDMHAICVCVTSVCEIYQRIIIKLKVKAFTILCLFLLCFCSVCVSYHSDSLSASLIKY